MNRSPGHQKWPSHKVQETPMDTRVGAMNRKPLKRP